MILEGIVSVISSPTCLLLILFGVFIGIIFGSIPGLSATMAICLFLPLSFGMDSINGVSLLLGLYVGGISGGLISAILLKIPGTPSSVTTVFDGGPMADRGEAGKALGIGILYSFIGGIVSLTALVFIAPLLAKWALNFSSVEYAAVTLFSLTVISAMSGDNPITGFISGFVGLLLGCIGISPIDNYARLTFGTHKLDSGIGDVAMMMGFFAVCEFFLYISNYTSEMKRPLVKSAKIKGYGISLKEFITTSPTLLIALLIGIGIGILPGIGGGIACLVAYAAAKSLSKDPDKFGKGCIEGLIASETSNNATTGGAMIPMLTLGIPGSPTAAMIMSGLMVHAVNPGPLIFQNNGKVMYAIFTAMLVANVVMLVLERLGLPMFVKLLSIPKNVLLPCVIVLCALGCYTYKHITFDVILMLVFGLVGWLLRKGNVPTTPAVIGYCIGPTFERYLRRTMINSQGSLMPFLNSKISVAFLIAAVLFLLMPFIQKKIIKKTLSAVNKE